jgi:hypothetical protein
MPTGACGPGIGRLTIAQYLRRAQIMRLDAGRVSYSQRHALRVATSQGVPSMIATT